MVSPITPKNPSSSWLEHFLKPSLLAAKSYHIDAPNVPTKLDQNESPFDWPTDFKNIVLKALAARSWNRYPVPYPIDLGEMVAKDSGLSSHKQILFGPGSNYLITLVMDALCHRHPGRLVIARPSFPLYEAHAAYSGAEFTPWNLNADLEYDINMLPPLGAGSVVLFASPNNPVGNSLPSKDLKTLLQKYPDTLFFADEAYFEFSDDTFTNLLADHHNLLIVRTFSKALGAAGLRLGYIMGSETLVQEIAKLRVPYMLNQFSLVAAKTVMESTEMREFFGRSVEQIKSERQRVYETVLPLSKKHGFVTKPTQANFILLRWPSTAAANVVYQRLVERGVLIRNVSGAPGLAGCLRMTISTPDENKLFLKALTESLDLR